MNLTRKQPTVILENNIFIDSNDYEGLADFIIKIDKKQSEHSLKLDKLKKERDHLTNQYDLDVEKINHKIEDLVDGVNQNEE